MQHRPTESCYCLILCLQACPTGQQMIRTDHDIGMYFYLKVLPSRDQVPTPGFIDACVMEGTFGALPVITATVKCIYDLAAQ